MHKTQKIMIGIQARSTSQRLPGKALAQLGNKTVLGHVIDAALNAQRYLARSKAKLYEVSTVLLVPTGDKIAEVFAERLPIYEGSEPDVLSRYLDAASKLNPDFICRITGDCPMLPPYVISKHISVAVLNHYDYLSNVDEECGLTLDGLDVEVMSAKMLTWLAENASAEDEREHVTIAIRRRPPPWASMAFTAAYFDQASLKLSIDTEEDLQRVRRMYEEVGKKLMTARRIYGEKIHRF